MAKYKVEFSVDGKIKLCGDCPFMDWERWSCVILDEELEAENEDSFYPIPPKNCPLKEVRDED